MDLLTLVTEKYKKLLSENKIMGPDKLKESYEIFQKNFNPDRLKSLDGELLLETMFNHGNRGSLVYWLEFKNDDELQTNRFGGIGGGSAFKFGIYKRKEDGKWITGTPKDSRELSINEAIEMVREKRDLLVKGCDLLSGMKNDFEDSTYLKLQSDIDTQLENYGNLGWVHKYFHMMFPDKLDDFHSVDYQNFYLIKMREKPIKSDGRYALAGQFLRQSMKAGIPINNFTEVLFEIFGSVHNYWRIGTSDGKKSYWSEMLEGGYMSIGWPNLGDLHQLDNLSSKEAKDHIKKVLSDTNPNTPSAIGRAASQVHYFFRDIKPNDIVIASDGHKALGVGRVIGEYEYRKGLDFPHIINVKWQQLENTKLPNPAEGIRTTVNQYKDLDNLIAIEALIDLPASDNVEAVKSPQKTLDSLNGLIAQIESTLNRKKQIILYGPPGTGKTYWAEKACLELASRKAFRKTYEDLTIEEKFNMVANNDSNHIVRFCCFHPSYGYEDFIEGIKPTIINDQTVFSLKSGIFKKLCEDAKSNSEKNYYLIIDEINRGDISRIFGELIMLIEAGKRGKETILPLSGDSFSVPDNLYIIGTMNTADRSIALLDIALRRRFGFIELMPDYSIFTGITIEDLPVGLWLKELNKRIVEFVGRDARNLQIGHSYFMEKGVAIKDFDKFRKIVQEDVIPLIEEYCYGDYMTISKIIGSSFVDTNRQEINQDLFKSVNKADLIPALLEPNPEIATSSSVQVEDLEEEQLLESEDIIGEQKS
ncbi:5-methylcytosine-specific restriction protein B [Natranaerovirga pectinivora]|uniref:5-methylcytosine-specific restriction protein B n=1 Tax=Natranaerovirga pectinivora TaxID=682400 RepID=A0A4R3MJV7_9FIRM|nr:AAA family ATPase [Natranaerovirga pectinivora]TCT14545.1 5-methylcytosine-specific restriction protein B [Natranaerovirga pectinivora]